MRYRIIDNCITNKQRPHPSIADLVEACTDILGKTFSESTIQKDVKAMKEDSALGFFAPIKYSASNKGYYYSDPNYSIKSMPLNQDDLDSIEFAASILQQFSGLGIFDQFDNAIDKIFNAINVRTVLEEDEIPNIIEWEQTPAMGGNHHLAPLLSAIKERRKVELEYRRFDSKEAKSYLIHPYLLKEYGHRWYLLCLNENNNRVTTFALDRIQSVILGDETYPLNSGFNNHQYFQHSFGITSYDGEPEKVVLSFSPRQGQYILSQPLHRSQALVSKGDDSIVIELNVGMTIELEMEILKYGEDVEVLAPSALRQKIQSRLAGGLRQYQS